MLPEFQGETRKSLVNRVHFDPDHDDMELKFGCETSDSIPQTFEFGQ